MVSTDYLVLSEIITYDEELRWEATSLRVINGDLEGTRSEGGVQKREREAGWRRGRDKRRERDGEHCNTIRSVCVRREADWGKRGKSSIMIHYHANRLAVWPRYYTTARRHLLMLFVIEHSIASVKNFEKSQRRKVKKWKGARHGSTETLRK